MKILLGCLVICYSCFAYSQTLEKDLIYLSEVQIEPESYQKYPGNNRNFMKTKRKGIIAKINPLRISMGGLMFVYQNVISSQLSSRCNFQLSCSNFSKAAIAEFGWVKGLALSADRLMRCNRGSVSEVVSVLKDEDRKVIDKPKWYRRK